MYSSKIYIAEKVYIHFSRQQEMRQQSRRAFCAAGVRGGARDGGREKIPAVSWVQYSIYNHSSYLRA